MAIKINPDPKTKVIDSSEILPFAAYPIKSAVAMLESMKNISL